MREQRLSIQASLPCSAHSLSLPCRAGALTSYHTEQIRVGWEAAAQPAPSVRASLSCPRLDVPRRVLYRPVPSTGWRVSA